MCVLFATDCYRVGCWVPCGSRQPVLLSLWSAAASATAVLATAAPWWVLLAAVAASGHSGCVAHAPVYGVHARAMTCTRPVSLLNVDDLVTVDALSATQLCPRRVLVVPYLCSAQHDGGIVGRRRAGRQVHFVGKTWAMPDSWAKSTSLYGLNNLLQGPLSVALRWSIMFKGCAFAMCMSGMLCKAPVKDHFLVVTGWAGWTLVHTMRCMAQQIWSVRHWPQHDLLTVVSTVPCSPWLQLGHPACMLCVQC